MQRRAAILGFFVLTTLLPAAALAGPGSGTATITPSAEVVVGSSGTWEIVYTADELFLLGAIQLKIPPGWTLPQNSSPTSPGYVDTTGSDAGAVFRISSINGINVFIDVDSLAAGQHIKIAYGHDNAGPSARATAPTTPHTALFEVFSNPSGRIGLTPIASPPSIDVVAGLPDRLVFLPGDSTVTAGEFLQFTIAILDAYDNRTPATQNRKLALTAPSGAFFLPADLTNPIDTVDILTDVDSIVVNYSCIYSTDGAKHTLDATTSDGLLPALSGSSTCDVAPAAVSKLVFTASDFPGITALDIAGPFEVQSHDDFGNPSPMPSDQLINLQSTSGSGEFSLQGGANFSPVSSATIPAGERSVEFYYRDPKAGEWTITAEADGEAWQVSTPQTVAAAPPARLLIEPDPAVVEAGVSTPYTVTVVDVANNPSPVTQDRTIALYPPSGSFYVGGSPRDTIQIATGDSVRAIDYVGEAAISNGFIVMQTNDAKTPVLLGIAAVEVQPTDPDAALSIVDATTGVTASGSDSSVVTITVKDQFGNGVPGVAVLLSKSGGDAIVSDPEDTTDGNGVAIGYVTNTTAETVTISATADGLPITDTAQITFVAGQADPNSSTIAAVPLGGITADGVAATTITVTAKDATGNPVQNATVTLTASPPGGTILAQPALLTDASGQTTGELQSTVARVYTIRAIINGAVDVVDSVMVSFVAGPVDLTVSTVEVNPSTGVVANGVDVSNVTVTVTDAQGNPKQGVNVVIDADGSATVPVTGGTTDESGQAFGAVRNTVAETVRVFATANGSALADTAQVTFVSGGVDPTTSSIIATPTSVVANGSSFSSITVTARDAQNNPVAGKTVSLSVAPNDGIVVLNPTGGVTGTDGTMTATILSTKAQDYQIDAVVDGVPLPTSATVTFTPGSIASFTLSVPSSGMAGVAAPVTITAFDSQGNLKTNYVGTVNLSTNATGTIAWWPGTGLGVLGPSTYQFALGDNGQATIAVSDTKMETMRVYAVDSVVGSATGTSGEIAIDNADAAAISIVAGNSQTATVFTDLPVSPKIKVTDAYNNPVDGETVTFRLVQARNFGFIDVDTGSGGPVDSTGTTDAAGELECEKWRLGQQTGENRLRAVIGVASVDFTANGTPGPGASIDILPTNQNVNIDANLEVTATLYDQYNNPVEGEQVSLFIKSPAEGTLTNSASHTTNFTSPTSRWGITDADGRTSVDYVAPNTAGVSDNVDASASGVPDGIVVDRVYTIITTGATQLRITFVGGSTAQAGSSFEMLVEAVDSYGNPDPSVTSTVTITPEGGSNLEFSLTDFGSTITQFALVGGERTVYGLGNAVGDWDITMSAAGLGSAIDPVTIVDAGAIARYAVSTVPSVTAGQNFSVTIQALDAFNNVVTSAGTTVDLVAVSDADTTALLPVPLFVDQATLVNGTVTVTEQYALAGDMRVRARDGSNREGFSATVSVGAASEYQIVKISGDNSGIAAGTDQDLVAEVRDQFDNPVSGSLVTFVITEGGGVLEPETAASGTDGRVTVTFSTGPIVGDNRVKATILDGTPESRERIDYLVSTEAGGIDSLIVAVDKTTMVAGETIGVTILALDENQNLVESDSTSVISLTASGSATLPSGTETLVGGVVNTTVTDTNAENFIVQAQVQGSSEFYFGDIVTVRNAPAYRVVKASGDAVGITVGAAQPLEVDVADQYGNPVPNEFVRYVVASAPDGTASLYNNGIAQTDGSGHAVDTLYTASKAGDNIVDSWILDSNPPALERVTFNVSTIADSIAYYVVETDVSEQTAGVPVTVTVRAYDSSDNLVVGDNTTAVDLLLDPGTGPVWGDILPITLEAGTLQTTVTVQTVQTFNIRAQTAGDPSTTGISPAVTIVPDVPAGVVALIPAQSTITANGLSTVTITSGVIRDQFGNQVAQNELMSIATNSGNILSGTPQPVRADGTIQFILQSADTIGTASVTVNSVTGSASGSVDITFAPPPDIATDSEPIPNSVIIGTSAAFRVPVENTSSTSVTLTTTGTTLEFNDGSNYFVAQLASVVTVLGSSQDTLDFEVKQIPADITPARYQPVLILSGTDEFGSPWSGTSLLPPQSLLVSSIEITAISANRINSTISRGASDTLRVTVHNPTPDIVTVISAAPVFTSVSGGVKSYNVSSALNLPLPISGDEYGTVYIPVMVDEGSPTGVDEVDARVTAQIGGNTATDNTLLPYGPIPTWEIVTARDIQYVAGSLSPGTVSIEKTYQMEVRLYNEGDATVTIETDGTTLSFTDGASTYSAALADPIAIPGQASQLLTFEPQAVPAGMTPGVGRDVTIIVAGTENGVPFTDTLLTSSQSEGIDVVTGANVVVQAGTLTPDTVSKGTSVAFEVQVENQGGATVYLDPEQTRFRFGGLAYEAFLDDNFTTTLTPGFHTLVFRSEVISASLAPGPYTPAVDLVGTENGLLFSQTPSFTDQISVQEAPDINITELRPSQERITTDQTRPFIVWMTVVNNGDATVRLDSARVRFILGGVDRTNQFSITNPNQFMGGVNLLGSATDSLGFVVTDKLTNAMSRGVMTIEGRLWVTDLNGPTQIFANTDLGGKGSLVVQSPADLVIQSIEPTQDPVTRLQTYPPFQIKVAVTNSGESDARLAMTMESTMVGFGDPTTWVRTLRPTLAIGNDDILSGSETDTVVFDVTQAGDTPGPITISAVVRGEEINSGDLVLDAESIGSIQVQNPAQLTVSSVRTTRPTITEGTSVPWAIRFNVQNTGQAAMDLTLPGSVTVAMTDEELPSSANYVMPTSLMGGGTALAGGEIGELEILVLQTGTFSSFGTKALTVGLSGVENNTGDVVPGTAAGTITVQEPANPQYLASSLEPNVVSKGSSESFSLLIDNLPASRATMRIDRAQTRFRFGDGLYEAAMAASSPDSIPGGQSRRLVFASQVVDTRIDSADTVSVELHWKENGAVSSRTLDLPGGELTVQEAGQLQIVSITTTQPTVTQSQAKGWWIDMTVRNNGQADVRLSLDTDSTFFEFEPLVGLPVTDEYGAIVFESGDPLITGDGGQQTYRYRVPQGGTTTGPIKINAVVSGYDQTSGLPVMDTTIDGGSGGFTLQTPADLDIVRIAPAQPTATVDQTTSYLIRVAVRNNGESAAKLGLSPDSTSLTFSPDAGWDATVQSALGGGGSILRGGQTDTILVRVNTTGSTAQPTDIGAIVRGAEINSDDPRIVQVDPGTPGSGTIDVQNEAMLSITGVSISQPTITENSPKDWIIAVLVRNAGEADAEFLPGTLAVTIQDAVSGTIISYPSEFQSGGTSLPGNGPVETLRIRVTDTGSFAPLGAKTITVFLEAEELNSSSRPSASDNSASVTVQSAPALEYVATTLDPQVVSRGTSVGFQLNLRNPGANAATARLGPTTEFTIEGAPYTTTLTAADSIPADGELTLTFNSANVDVNNSTYPVSVSADYSHNGNAVINQSIAVSESVTVQNAPDLSIVSILPSQPTLTANQSRRWFVDMVVRNNGQAPVALDLSQTATRLVMDHVTAGPVTGEYQITWPETLQIAGTDTLTTGEPDTLKFTVTTSGGTVGGVNIEGVVEGEDVNNGNTLTDDTRLSGGGGFVTVQEPAGLVVKRITTSQETVTEGQTAPWSKWVVVENTGGSTLNLDLEAAFLSFDKGADWTVGTATGDTDLVAGEVDSLEFTVSHTTDSTGVRIIDAFVRGTDANSGFEHTYNTATQGGSGSVLVQTRPNLRFIKTSTAVVAPNGAQVNTGQTFRVAVELENTGEAGANQVRYQINGQTAGTPSQSSRTIDSIAGGDAQVDTFNVTAASTPVTDYVVMTIDEAFDDNSNLLVLLTDPDRVDSAEIAVQYPAVLVVESAVASQTTVTKQQTQPWYLTVSVSNTGEAPLQIDVPSASDLTFLLDGSLPQNGYSVVPPAQFESGDKNWVVEGGTSETMVYTVDVTGSKTGQVTVQADINARDFNDPARQLSGNAQTIVTVQDPSGLYVESTTIGGLYYQSSNIWYVNTGDSFFVDVDVTNTGEAVRDVKVSLSSDFTAPPPDTIVVVDTHALIDTDETKTFEFKVFAQNTAVDFQTLTAHIDQAFSVNTSQPVEASPPVDNTEFIIVQSPATLSIDTFYVELDTLSTNQDFDVTARVINEGQAGVKPGGLVTVTPPQGFTFSEGGADQALVLDTDIVWHLTAPPDARNLDTLYCDITKFPTDRNNNADALTNVARDSIEVTVLEAGDLPVDIPVVAGPPGAVDDTVSTDQTFKVSFTTTPKPAHVDLTATVNLPPGFQTVGQSTILLADGDGTAQTDTFTIQAPNVRGGGSITVTVSGTDRNTNDPVTGFSPALEVTAVKKANLSLTAWIAGPPDAQDSTVTIGSIFRLEAKVTNSGTAGIDLKSVPTVRLVLPSGYAVSDTIQSFEIDSVRTWNVTAPVAPSGPDAFTIRIEDIPYDENSNLPAAVSVRERSIPIVTEGASVAMTDVTQTEGIDNKVVPGGTKDVDKFAFTLDYQATDSLASDARVEAVHVSILDKEGRDLSDNAVRATLSSVYVRVNDDRVEKVNPGSNPVVVDLSQASSAVVPTNGSVMLTVGVSVDRNPSAQEFRVAFKGTNSIDVIDSGSSQRLGVINAGTGRPIGNEFQSTPLVVLSGDFQEYAHNYPNPFQAGVEKTSITYKLDVAGDVQIKIYDMTGAMVNEWSYSSGGENATQGPHEVPWDGRNKKGEVIRNGIYVCVIKAGGQEARFRIAVAK